VSPSDVASGRIPIQNQIPLILSHWIRRVSWLARRRHAAAGWDAIAPHGSAHAGGDVGHGPADKPVT